MCGRYYIASEDDHMAIKEIIEEINNKYKGTPELSDMKTGEIRPADIAPVITAQSPVLMKWGFTRRDGKGLVINARLETAAEKPMFRHAFAGKRCLIPASWYFEWEKHGAARQKYAIGLREPIFMAGLYRIDNDKMIPRFVILTRPAAPEIAFIHNRMPVILPKPYHEPWLNRRLDVDDVMKASVASALHYDPINFQPTLF